MLENVNFNNLFKGRQTLFTKIIILSEHSDYRHANTNHWRQAQINEIYYDDDQKLQS